MFSIKTLERRRFRSGDLSLNNSCLLVLWRGRASFLLDGGVIKRNGHVSRFSLPRLHRSFRGGILSLALGRSRLFLRWLR